MEHKPSSDQGGGRRPSDLLRMEVERKRLSARLAPVGEIDLFTSPELAKCLEALSEDPAVRQVTVDLSAVSFLDGSGLQVLLTADSVARRDGFDLSFIRPPPHIHRLFVLTGMDRHLSFRDDSKPPPD